MVHFEKLWHGKTSFLTIISFLILVTVGFNFMGHSALVEFPVALLLSIGLGSLLQCLLAVRYCEQVIGEGEIPEVYGVYSILGIAVVSNVILAIGILLPPPEMDLEIEGYVQKVHVEGTTARVTGEITYQVLTELKAAGPVELVVFESDGGIVQAGRSIGIFIASMGWNTHTDGQCFSACTLAFAGGIARSLGPDGRLGFHSYQFDPNLRVRTLDPEVIIAKDRAYLLEMGISATFIERIFQTPAAELWQPDRGELEAAGVLR